MNCITIVFDTTGLEFCRLDGDGTKQVVHQVAASTLSQMNLADLEHCLSANALSEMPRLRAVFADYLWSDDGAIPPVCGKNSPRVQNGAGA